MVKAYRTCPLCEATCGLEIDVQAGRVGAIRGDRDDVLSGGFLCPKGYSLKVLQEDPDRLRQPLRRTPSGSFEPVSWEDAFTEIDQRLSAIIDRDGRDAVAAYIGNPSAHNLSALIYARVLLQALDTRNIYSASTVDQYPKQMAAALMFGTATSVPIPDVDRTDHLLIFGANPMASNGSLMTAPDMRGRLRALRERGGKLVVIDPQRSRTAEVADEHHFIRPGTDALALMAMVATLFEEDLVDLGAADGQVVGLDEVHEHARRFTPETVEDVCAIPAPQLRRLARELAAAPRAAVYGRIGTCTQEFGSLASWLVDVLNTFTGNLDRAGGAMFTRAAAGATNTRGAPGRGRGARFGRFSSRVRGLEEVFGELPVACLSEEIETPGDGQVRALITLAGNPIVSTPNSGRLGGALARLELMVSVDIYLNETTRHADFVLPGPSPLERSHYDLALYQFAVRNVANYSPPLLDRPAGMPAEWETLLRLAAVAAGQGSSVDIEAFDDRVALEAVRREIAEVESPVAGRDPAALLAELADVDGVPRRGPERILDLLLRCGPYGDGFGARAGGLSLATLEAAPHGVDLGALAPRLPEVLRTPSGRVELAPAQLIGDIPRLLETLERRSAAAPRLAGERMVLVGRRQVRSNNSWMHNLPVLVKGPDRCTLQVHPDDAAALALVDGATACVSSRAGSVLIPVEVTDAVMPGVVSIPHGWGHDDPGIGLRVASAHAGVNSNVLTDEMAVDAVSGNAVLNGIPVELEAVSQADSPNAAVPAAAS